MDAPIFIVGTPRSGTTLTAKILGRHSKIFMPGETHFFDDIYSRHNKFGDPPSKEAIKGIIIRLKTIYARYNESMDQKRITLLFKKQGACLEDQLLSCGSYKEILSLFMKIQAEELGKLRWGNNTPRDLFHVDSIIDFYPDAKFIVCVRDVRDFLLSYKYKWRATTAANVPRLKQLYHPVTTSMLWKSSTQRILEINEYISNQNLVIIRYEDLVTQPEYVIQKICRVIRERFEPRMLSVKESNSSRSEQSLGIFTSSVGRWRTDLETEDAWIAQYIAGKELKRIGYKCEKISVNYIKVAYKFLTFPVSLGKALYVNRDKRGPLLPYLKRRVLPFLKRLQTS